MKLFSKEETNRLKKQQTEELVRKNDKLVSSLRKTIALQNDIDIDTEKIQRNKAFMVWCDDLNDKKGVLLKELKAYETARDKAKEDLFTVLSRMDLIKDEILDKEEELRKLKIQVEWNKEVLIKRELAYGV